MKELVGRAEQCVLRWCGHMERMEEERLVKRIVESDVRGVRLRGRPRMRWMDSLKTELNERRIVCGARKNDCA